MVPSPQDIQNISQRRGLRRSDNPDAARQRRDRLFAGGIEQALGFEFGFSCSKANCNAPAPLGSRYSAESCKSPGLVNGYAASQYHLHAVFRTEAQQAR